ncbi:hypothetical protein ACFV42_48150 [Streptomyces solisilvae]|uniref:hypothetical protein n=1 Tax=Streptomyces malaysiensis TaxID=92644 RepID=UPI0036AB5C14
MAVVGERTLPISYVVATATGTCIGYWRSGRLLTRQPPRTGPSKDPDALNHQPRHHTPTQGEQDQLRRDVTAAPLLDLTEVTDSAPGRILPVMSVGLLDEPHIPYIRLTDRSLYRLPELLRPWVQSFIRAHLQGIQHGTPPLLPARIEFGVRGGRALADLKKDRNTTTAT